MIEIRQTTTDWLMLSESTSKESVNLYQGSDWVLIEKGQPLQELIDYLTEVNKDFKQKENEK